MSPQSKRDQSRTAARRSLEQAAGMLRGERINVSLLCSDMRSAVNWAVDCWLRQQSEAPGVSWSDQEFQFLRVAPGDLRGDYLRLVGELPRLAQDLFDLLGTDGAGEINGTAPSLRPWKAAAAAWTQNAAELIARLVDEQVPTRASTARRVEAGALQGRLDGLVPCLLLVQPGGHYSRLRHAGGQAGLFSLGQPNADRSGSMISKGLVMPLSLCRDQALREKLLTFSAMLRPPALDTPAWRVADRRRALQNWLDREGLGTLRLADQEPVQRWTRFTLNAAVYSDLLARCDYVTAIADDQGQTSRILDHAPFAWASHGALLDWYMGHDLSMPVSPFHLYLATDASGLSDPFRPGRSRDWQFRPVSYWAPFTQPVETAQTAPVSVRLTQEEADYGWIDLDLGLGEGTTQITLSEVYDPLPALLDWLKAVEDGDLPLGVAVDEEGSEAWLIAHEFDEHRLLVAVLDRYERTERVSAVVNRTDFIEVFQAELLRFLSSELDTERWNTREEDDSKYLERLLTHPFFGKHSDA